MSKSNDVSLSELRAECGKHGYEFSYTGNDITGIHQFTIETVEVAMSETDTRMNVYDEHGVGHSIGSYYLTVDEAVEAWKEQMKGEKR